MFKRLAIDQGNHLSRLVVRLAIAAVAVGIVVILAATAIVNGFQHSIPAKFTGFWGHIQVSRLEISQSFEQQPFSLRAGMRDSIAALPETHWLAPYATKAGIIRTDEAFEGVALKGIDSTYCYDFLASCLVAGELPDYHGESNNDILLPQSIAKRMKLKLGDKIQLYFIQDPPRVRVFTVKGIYKLGIEGEFNKSFVICDLRHIQRLNGWEEHTSGGLEVHLHSMRRLHEVAYEISDLVDMNLEAYSIQELYPNLFSWLQLFDLNKQVLMVIMLLVAGINIVSALLILILERTQTIGLFKAFGMQNRDIRMLFLLTGSYIAGIGMLLGNGLALLLYWLQTRFSLIKLNEESYYVAAVPLKIALSELLLLNAVTLGLCVLLLVLPSLAIARIRPLEAIRFD
ncbi:MAG: ABC transporter permease [Bacteroidia bacterium]